MSDSVIGINTARTSLKKVWKQAKEIIDKLGPDYYIDDFILGQCPEEFRASYEKRPGSRFLRRKCILRVLQSVCSLERKFPFQPEKVTLARIRKKTLKRFKVDYGEGSTFLALLVLEDNALLLPGHSFYATQRFGRQVVSVLKKLKKSDPDRYGMYVRKSRSRTTAPKKQKVPDIGLAT